MNGGYIGGRGGSFCRFGVYQVAFSSKSKSSSLNDYDDEVVGGRIPSPSLNSHAFGGRRARDVSCDKDPKSARR